MPGSVPPDPTLVEILTSVFLFLAASLPIAIGTTLAVVAERGGVVAARVRALAVPAAVILALSSIARPASTLQIAVDAAAVLRLVVLRWRTWRGLPLPRRSPVRSVRSCRPCRHRWVLCPAACSPAPTCSER